MLSPLDNAHQNGAFIPGTTNQLVWDSTSLGELKLCPRKYQYTIINGYATAEVSAHLTFGLVYHAALENYDHAICAGSSREDALESAVRFALSATWDKQLSRPWLSDEPNKNRLTLLRTIVWYLDQFEHDTLQTLVLDNGKPAVELSFRFETDYTAPNGQPYALAGHLDRVVKDDAGDLWISDRKTTKSALGSYYFESYSPDNQMSLYAFGGKVALNLPVRGIIVDAAQILVNSSRFQRGIIPRTDAQLTEWYKDLEYQLKAAEQYAMDSYWPMNDKSCGLYGGCPFRFICSKSPSVREQWLSSHYKRRKWDPTIPRGNFS